MRKGTKLCLLVATSLLVLGALVFVITMTANGWDFKKLNTSKVRTSTYEIGEAFTGISVDVDTADVILLPSDDGKSRVVCTEEERLSYSVFVQDGTLKVNLTDERKWYDHIQPFDFSSHKITVYLPQGEYESLVVSGDTGDVEIPSDFNFTDVELRLSTGDVKYCASAREDVKIRTSTGSITVENVSVGSLDLVASTGNVRATGIRSAGNVAVRLSTGDAVLVGVRCKNLFTEASTGNLSMTDVIASERFEIERSTGDIQFEACDAAEIKIETDTGEVEGSLLSEKTFFVETDTGSVDVPRTVGAGRCEISTDTGDVRITIHNQ